MNWRRLILREILPAGSQITAGGNQATEDQGGQDDLEQVTAQHISRTFSRLWQV